jgi:hypothetical protein
MKVGCGCPNEYICVILSTVTVVGPLGGHGMASFIELIRHATASI